MKHPSYSATECIGGVKELVRGQEQELLSKLQPLVVRQNVTLNLQGTRRIDAAGIAALITLYCDACKAGYAFAISNPAPHVAELLAIVGLDRLLVSRNAEKIACPSLRLQESAA